MENLSRKKILLLVPTLRAGGQERVAVNTAEILESLYDVTLVVFNGRDIAYDTDCKIIDLHFPAIPGTFQKIQNSLRRANALSRLKAECGASAVISFGRTANLVNALSVGDAGKIIHLDSYGQSAPAVLNWFLCAQSDQIISCSKVTGARLANVYSRYQYKMHDIFNPINIRLLSDKGAESVDDYIFSKRTIVSHGRLNEVKNYPRLIKAFSLVRQKIPDVQLLIIGEGPMREKLQGLIEQYGLEESVTLLGFRKNPFAYLSKSSLYVLSSYTEGFPNALVEGMAFLPAVSVDCLSGPREILSDGPLDHICTEVEATDYGVLVPAAKETGWNPAVTDEDRLLAEGILSVLTDSEKLRRMKERAHIRAEGYSFEVYQESLVKVIES